MKKFTCILKKRAKLNNNGSTMVEVLIAFTVLAIVLASLLGVVKLSGQFLAKSERMVAKQEEFVSLYYKKDTTGTKVDDVLFTLEIEGETEIPLTNIGLEKYNSENDLGMEDFPLTVYKFKRKDGI